MLVIELGLKDKSTATSSNLLKLEIL